jgi:hypothetical protein
MDIWEILGSVYVVGVMVSVLGTILYFEMMGRDKAEAPPFAAFALWPITVVLVAVFCVLDRGDQG